MTKERSLDLRNDDDTICRNWFQAIKYLIKRIRSKQELKKNSKINIEEISDKKEAISNIWRTEILPNWHNYRQFIMLNRKNIKIFSGDTKKKIQKFKKILDKKIKQRTEEYNLIIFDNKNQSDVIFLWILGLPGWLRSKLWPLVIGNHIQISENLFQNYNLLIENIDFSCLRKEGISKLASKDFKSFYRKKEFCLP